MVWGAVRSALRGQSVRARMCRLAAWVCPHCRGARCASMRRCSAPPGQQRPSLRGRGGAPGQAAARWGARTAARVRALSGLGASEGGGGDRLAMHATRRARGVCACHEGIMRAVRLLGAAAALRTRMVGREGGMRTTWDGALRLAMPRLGWPRGWGCGGPPCACANRAGAASLSGGNGQVPGRARPGTAECLLGR